jgi:hypothetical protein
MALLVHLFQRQQLVAVVVLGGLRVHFQQMLDKLVVYMAAAALVELDRLMQLSPAVVLIELVVAVEKGQ